MSDISIRRRPRRTLRDAVVLQRGSGRAVVIWLLVACALFGTMALKMYRDGSRDFGYIAFISIIAVLAVAFLAPRRFHASRGASPDWEDDSPYEIRPGYRPKPEEAPPSVAPPSKDNVP